MHIVPTIRTSYGYRLLPPAPMVRISVTATELRTLICTIDREAIQAEREGRFAASERLRHRMFALQGAAL